MLNPLDDTLNADIYTSVVTPILPHRSLILVAVISAVAIVSCIASSICFALCKLLSQELGSAGWEMIVCKDGAFGKPNLHFLFLWQ